MEQEQLIPLEEIMSLLGVEQLPEIPMTPLEFQRISTELINEEGKEWFHNNRKRLLIELKMMSNCCQVDGKTNTSDKQAIIGIHRDYAYR